MDKITFYGQITKKDEDQRIVEGLASSEAVDSQGEIVKTEAIEKALPGYMNFANLREMHQWSAVGKTLEARVEKGKKTGLWIKGKIVDDGAWQKVKEGVYNGFSIGGKVLKKVGNVIQELQLNEISLVDRPANPEAIFSLVKIKKGGRVIEKQAPVAPTAMEEALYTGVRVADQLVAMATNLTYIIESCESQNRPTAHLERVVKYLKRAAMAELESEKVAMDQKAAETKADSLRKLAEAKAILKRIVEKKSQPHYSAGYFEKLAKAV